MRPLFIIGYMATGKTTFGEALASHLGLNFIDLDKYIEMKSEMTVPEIFKKFGETGFRALESRALEEVAEKENSVIACGGGTPCFNSNMELMMRKGLTVCLEASMDCIIRRVMDAPEKRPLLASLSADELKTKIRVHLKERNPFYSRAEIKWDGEKLENEEQIRDNIEAFVNFFNDFIANQKTLH